MKHTPSPVGFSGARRVPAAGAARVAQVAPLFTLPTSPVYVGCAGGVDEQIRQLYPAAEVLAVASGRFGRGRGAFVARSLALVGALAPAGLLVAFPLVECPPGILPARGWTSGTPGSGTWSTAAVAAGRGCSLVVVPLAAFAPPAWPGFVWRPSPVVAGAWALVPAPVQPSLF